MDNIYNIQDLKQEIETLKNNILKRNEIIDSQRVKLKRYEFCVQEAIIFLGKPVLAYTDWLKGNIEKGKSPQSLAEKQINQQNAVYTINNINTLDTTPGILDIKALECIKLALNYLVNARNSITKLESSPVIVDLNSDLDREKRLEILDGIDKLKPKFRSASEPVHCISSTNGNDQHRNRQYPIQNVIEEEDDIDGDISVIRREDKKVDRKSCQLCTQRMLQIDKLKETIMENQTTIHGLSLKIKEEIESKERILVSKEILEQELEDLTEQLFEQANNMVIEEAKSKLEIENKNITLAAELTGAIRRAQGREEEIQDLKKIISALKTAKIKASNLSLVSSPSMSIIPMVNTDLPKGIFSFEKLPQNILTDNLFIDGILYSEVQDHISSTLMSSEMNISTQFMKRVLNEDVEPILFYCYSFSGSLKNIGAGGVGSSFKKRFLDGIIRCMCEFKDSHSTEEGSEKDKIKCGLCTVVRNLPFKFHFGQKSEEIQVCRFCKDRILACMDFFTYNNFLRINKPNSSILNIFRCFMWLRKR